MNKSDASGTPSEQDGADAGKDEACCALCGELLSERELDVCRSTPDRFGGQLLCFAHQKRFSACSAVRWQPGR